MFSICITLLHVTRCAEAAALRTAIAKVGHGTDAEVACCVTSDVVVVVVILIVVVAVVWVYVCSSCIIVRVFGAVVTVRVRFLGCCGGGSCYGC